jgi:hypothetical protein
LQHYCKAASVGRFSKMARCWLAKPRPIAFDLNKELVTARSASSYFTIADITRFSNSARMAATDVCVIITATISSFGSTQKYVP